MYFYKIFAVVLEVPVDAHPLMILKLDHILTDGFFCAHSVSIIEIRIISDNEDEPNDNY